MKAVAAAVAYGFDIERLLVAAPGGETAVSLYRR